MTSDDAVRYVQHVHARHRFEQFAEKVLRGPDAARRHIDFPRIGFEVGDEFKKRRWLEISTIYDTWVPGFPRPIRRSKLPLPPSKIP